MRLPIILFISTLLLLSTSYSFGQDTSPFALGAKIGANLSDASEAESSYTMIGDKSAKIGYQFGITASYSINRSLYLSTGLSLTNKGTVHKGSDIWVGGSDPPVTTWKKTTNQNYLQLPIMIGYSVPVSTTVKLHVNAGAYYAYGIGGKEVTKTKTTPAEALEDEKITYATFDKNDKGSYSPHNLNRQDYGVLWGIGLQRKKFILTLDYELGLFNIYKPNNYENPPLPGSYKNKNIAFTLGYIL